MSEKMWTVTVKGTITKTFQVAAENLDDAIESAIDDFDFNLNGIDSIGLEAIDWGPNKEEKHA